MDVEQLLARRQVSLPPPNLVAAPLESFWADLFCTSAERQPPAATPTSVEELRVDLEESVRQIYEARRHPDLSQHNALWQQLQQVQKSVTSEVESSQQQILQLRVKCSELEAHVQRADGAFSRECQVSAALRDENAVLRREILQANTKAQLLSDKALLAESSSQSLRIENQQLHRFLQYTLKHATALREALDKSEESQRKVVEHFMSQLEVMRAKDMKLFMEREASLTSQFNASMHEVASCLQDTMLQREEGTTSRWNDRLDAFKVSVSASVKAVTQATDVVDRKVSSTLAQVEKSQKHMSDEQRVQLGQFLNAMNDRDNALQQRFQLMQNQHVEQLAKWSLLMDELQATYKHREARVERECVERLERQEEQFNRERDAMRSSHLQQLGEISQSHVQNEKELERHHRQIERELLESFRSTMRTAQHVAKQAEPSLTVSSSSDLLRKVQALEGRQRERADQLRGSVVDVSPDRGSAAPS